MKKAILISCFGWYFARLIHIRQHLEGWGYTVKVFNSDYNHIKKQPADKLADVAYIHVRPYMKNLSFARLYSHWGFSKAIGKILDDEQPDVVYALVPPNSVARVCAAYRRSHPRSKLIFDIIDMWPESYTAPKLLNLPFNLWRRLRDNNLRYADRIFTECSLYHNYLPEDVKDRLVTLYLNRDESIETTSPEWDSKTLNVAYLGSINNIIDIPTISSLLNSLSNSFTVNVHIIGDGISRNILVSECKKVCSGEVIEYGLVFDKDRIKEVVGSCHFALNVMKYSVCVGLTIKSMDYLQMGIPMFNTIKGDTRQLINKYGCGFNIDDVEKVSSKVSELDSLSYQKMRQSTVRAFEENLTLKAFKNEFKHGINNII